MPLCSHNALVSVKCVSPVYFLERPPTGGLQKVVARNYQYLGVNWVIIKLLSTEEHVKAEVTAAKLGGIPKVRVNPILSNEK